MRSIVFHFSALLGLVSLTLGLAPSVVGCSDGLSSSKESGPSNTSFDPGPPTSDASGTGMTDASTMPRPRLGSPLCRVQENDRACVPDDDGANQLPTYAQPCAAETPACRVELAKDAGALSAQCVPESNEEGVDGVSCTSGADCAPGYDCIDGERGSVCRHYCCTGSCDGRVSMNGGPTFCDIQKVVHRSGHSVPVCMPLKKCKLMEEGACSATETCGIVNEQGESGCVPIGQSKAGEGCDERHCAKDLTCLGYPGDRKCFKLCRTDGNDCTSEETCTTGALFQNAAFGVCTALARARQR